MRKLIITVIAIVCTLIIWQYLEYRKANSRVLPEIRLQEIYFPDNPQLKKQISDMVADMDPETKENPVYIVSIFTSPYRYDVNKLKVVINWYKNLYFANEDCFAGYFQEGNSVFIVGISELEVRLVRPGKSWRTFKSQTAYPLFGENVRWSYSYKYDSFGFTPFLKAERVEFDERIAKWYRDTIQSIVDSSDYGANSVLSYYGEADWEYRMP